MQVFTPQSGRRGAGFPGGAGRARGTRADCRCAYFEKFNVEHPYVAATLGASVEAVNRPLRADAPW